MATEDRLFIEQLPSIVIVIKSFFTTYSGCPVKISASLSASIALILTKISSTDAIILLKGPSKSESELNGMNKKFKTTYGMIEFSLVFESNPFV